MKIPLELIRVTAPRLYKTLQQPSVVLKGDDFISGPQWVWEAVGAWMQENNQRQAAEDARVHESQVKRKADLDADIAQAQRAKTLNDWAKDDKAGKARVEQYIKEQGLADVPATGELIDEYIRDNFKGYWSAANVDAAVKALRQRLIWWGKAPVVEAPAPDWKPGDRLPDNATEKQLRQSDIMEVMAWKHRRQMLDSKAQADADKNKQ